MMDNSSLREIQKDLDNHIQQYSYGTAPEELYEPIKYLMLLGGKRIRPLLTLLSFRLYQPNYRDILTPALAVEVFHNFTLMHDDIMDQAPLRRGQQTVHEKWDANTAILSGDVMLVKAYDMLLKTPQDKLGEAIRLFNKTATEVCEGQQLDMNFERQSLVSEGDYLEMIRLKTAVLVGFALQFGALLGGASDRDIGKLYTFGVNVGIGFQLKDDLLDVYADKSVFGKQVGGDIIANKKTYLLIKARELATGSLKTELDGWLEEREFDKGEKVKAVTNIYNELGIKALAEAKIKSYFDSGFDQLSDLQVEVPEALELLRSVTEELISREK